MIKLFTTPRFVFIFAVIFFAAFMRLIPHWPNFTPVAAIALFGGAMLNRKYLAFLIPLSALFLSDLILGFHSEMLAVYIAFSITVIIGLYLKNKLNAGTIIAASLSSSIIFFLITNFASWLGSPFYTANFSGLLQAYIAGLAFFNDGSIGISMFLNEVLSGLLFNTVFFGAYYLAEQKIPSIVRA